MPSPFPGMDPYLESPTHWSDFHSTFVNVMREAIAEKLPASYAARIDEHVLAVTPLLEDEGISPAYRPDVAVLAAASRGSSRQNSAQAAVATLEEPSSELIPVQLKNVEFLQPHVEAYLKVIRLPEMEVIAIIELISPTNKYGDGRGVYTLKRRELIRQPVHLIEIDLLRQGVSIELNDAVPRAHYHAFVSRADRRPICDVYSWSVRHPLPTIPIPLRAPDADVQLNLSSAFAVAFERGRYDRLIRYDAPLPAPRFSVEDAEWAAQFAVPGGGTVSEKTNEL